MRAVGFRASLLAFALAATLPWPGPAAAADEDDSLLAHIRLELGGGAQWGDPELTFAGASADLDTGVGYAVTAGGWVDQVLTDYVSVGVQYLRLDNSDFSQLGSVGIPGVSATGQFEFEPTIDSVMVNLVSRLPRGTFHPYAGGGVGVAFVSSDFKFGSPTTIGTSTFTGTTSADDRDTAFAWQIMAGMDVDITDKWYIGVNGRYFATNVTLFGIDVEFRNIAAMAVAGYRL